MRRSLAQTETSSEAVWTVLSWHLADATQLVNCSTAVGQQPRNSCHQGAFLLAERYKCRRPLIAVGVDQCLRRADSLRPDTVPLCYAAPDTRGQPVWSWPAVLNGNQWSCLRTGVMWSRRQKPVTSRAAAFCTDCRCWSRLSVTPHKSEVGLSCYAFKAKQVAYSHMSDSERVSDGSQWPHNLI